MPRVASVQPRVCRSDEILRPGRTIYCGDLGRGGVPAIGKWILPVAASDVDGGSAPLIDDTTVNGIVSISRREAQPSTSHRLSVPDEVWD